MWLARWRRCWRRWCKVAIGCQTRRESLSFSLSLSLSLYSSFSPTARSSLLPSRSLGASVRQTHGALPLSLLCLNRVSMRRHSLSLFVFVIVHSPLTHALELDRHVVRRPMICRDRGAAALSGIHETPTPTEFGSCQFSVHLYDALCNQVDTFSLGLFCVGRRRNPTILYTLNPHTFTRSSTPSAPLASRRPSDTATAPGTWRSTAVRASAAATWRRGTGRNRETPATTRW